MDIREFWPDITEEGIDALIEALGPNSWYEWLIVRRLYNDKRIGGREISEDDLMQGFPADKLMRANKAIKSLEKKRIIVKKPKPGIKIIQTPPDFFAVPIRVSFIRKITENEGLRRSLIDETLELTKMSEALTRIVDATLGSNRGIVEKRIASSEKIAYDGYLGLRVFIRARCQRGGCFEIEFDVVDPRDMSDLYFKPHCSCGALHDCGASGRVFSTFNEGF